METDAVIGIVLLAGSVVVLLGLVWWSRRRIDRIYRQGYGTARTIERELDGGG